MLLSISNPSVTNLFLLLISSSAYITFSGILQFSIIYLPMAKGCIPNFRLICFQSSFCKLVRNSRLLRSNRILYVESHLQSSPYCDLTSKTIIICASIYFLYFVIVYSPRKIANEQTCTETITLCTSYGCSAIISFSSSFPTLTPMSTSFIQIVIRSFIRLQRHTVSNSLLMSSNGIQILY